VGNVSYNGVMIKQIIVMIVMMNEVITMIIIKIVGMDVENVQCFMIKLCTIYKVWVSYSSRV
jgi:hypothetical protein